MDSGATHHFTGCKKFLFDYKPDVTPTAQMQVAVDVILPRAGTGTVKFETHIDGITHRRDISGVWYVPGLTINMISTLQLIGAGCWHLHGHNSDPNDYWFDKRNIHFLTCVPRKGLLVPQCQIYINSAYERHPDVPLVAPQPASASTAHCAYSDAMVASDRETPELWHQRLGHMTHQNLAYLVKHNLIRGVQLPADEFSHHKSSKECTVCVMAKHARAPFVPRPERAQYPLDVLHSDVCVYPVPSIEGALYAATLLDEHTGYAHVMVLRAKHEVEQALRGAIMKWSTYVGRSCKVLFTDRGGEYIGASFKAWCLDKGIAHEFSVPMTPQQNGKAERLNRTLNTYVRAMLLHYGLPKALWSHALLYACMVHNVSLNKRLKMTPFQAFHGKVPDVKNFRVFGCKVFARTPEQRRDKLDPNSQVGMYLGPVSDGPGHKVLCYTPTPQRKSQYSVYLFRDVVAVETLETEQVVYVYAVE
jgi:transposase InsO family protein